MMRQRRLPGTDLVVGELCYGLGGFGTRAGGELADRLLDAFLAAGGSLVDTAHVYAAWLPGGEGASERELGRQIRRVGRARLVICTKGGHPTFEPHYRRPDQYLDPARLAADLSESLERLQTDWVDLYLLHRDDPRVPVDELVDAMARFVDAGRVRYVGVSNWPIARLEAAHTYAGRAGLPSFVVLQSQWSLGVPSWREGPDPTTRTVAPDDAAWCAERGVSIMAYSSTSNGFFATGGAGGRSFDTALSRARLDRAEALAFEFGCTPNQIALAWLLAQPGTIIPVLGTCDEAHLADALGAPEVELTDEQLAWLASEQP